MEDNLLKWVGSKRILAPFIISKMPTHKMYVEVFAGAANIYWQKPLAPQFNVINDINSDLINMYLVMKDKIKSEKMVTELCQMPYGRDIFEHYKTLRGENSRLYRSLPDWERAAIYIYLNRYSYNGEFKGFSATESAFTDKNRAEKIIRGMHKKLISSPGTLIENVSFENIIKQWDKENTLMYIDPPYWVTTGSGSGYYEHVLDKKQHEELRYLLLNLQNAKFLLSYDDLPVIRKMYNEKGIYTINTPAVVQSSYSRQVGQQGKESMTKSELLIANYPIDKINTLFE